MAVVGQYLGEAGRNVDEWIAIRVARFDQRDRSIGVRGEITRNDAAGRASANNDDVVLFLGHQFLSVSRFFIVQSTTGAGAARSRRRMRRLVGPSLGK